MRGRFQEAGGSSSPPLGLEGGTGGPPSTAPSMNLTEGRDENREAICFTEWGDMALRSA